MLCLYTHKYILYKTHTHTIIISQLDLSLQLIRSHFLSQGSSCCLSGPKKFWKSLNWLYMLHTSHSAPLSLGVVRCLPTLSTLGFSFALSNSVYCLCRLPKALWSSVSALALCHPAGCWLPPLSLQMPSLVGPSSHYDLLIFPVLLSTWKKKLERKLKAFTTHNGATLWALRPDT